MKKVKLFSTCNVKGCEGVAGDVIVFKNDKLADRIIAGRGGVEVTEPKDDEEKKTE